MSEPPELEITCPLPFAGYERVVLAHGGGGREMRRLITELFGAELGAHVHAHDGARVATGEHTVLTTDAFTVDPLEFPGGDIGRLAVCGTVNDLWMCGARPRALSCAFVLEEGLELSTLRRVVRSMAAAAREADVAVVTGDTKVVERGKGDGLYVTTTGLGTPLTTAPVRPERITAGDAILVSGPVGDHGIAIVAAREGIEFVDALHSDVAPVGAPVAALFEAGIDVHCLRDPTRGGLASALVELCEQRGLGARVDESSIPVRPAVADACDLLGFDPLYVACEGRFVAFVEAAHADGALEVLRGHGCPDAAAIGSVTSDPDGLVVLVNPLGAERVLDLLSGEQLPRIC